MEICLIPSVTSFPVSCYLFMALTCCTVSALEGKQNNICYMKYPGLLSVGVQHVFNDYDPEKHFVKEGCCILTSCRNGL